MSVRRAENRIKPLPGPPWTAASEGSLLEADRNKTDCEKKTRTSANRRGSLPWDAKPSGVPKPATEPNAQALSESDSAHRRNPRRWKKDDEQIGEGQEETYENVFAAGFAHKK